MLYLFSNTFDILAVYKNPWEIEAVNNNILNQSTWATQELTNGFGISNEKHVCFMLWKQKLKGHKPCCGRGTQGRALKLRLFDCAPFPVVQVTRYIGDCDDVIVSTDEYLLWLPCHRAWLFGVAVRVHVWHPVDPGSSRVGWPRSPFATVTSLDLLLFNSGQDPFYSCWSKYTDTQIRGKVCGHVHTFAQNQIHI